MKSKIILFFILFCSVCYATDTYVDGYSLDSSEIHDWSGISAPSLSSSGSARVYYDSTSNTLKLSQNGGAFSDFVTVASNMWTRSGTDVYLTNSGDNVGIGTDNPASKLDVVGSITLSGNLTASGTGQSVFQEGVVINEAGGATQATDGFRVEGGTDENLIYTDVVNDRVGIGSSAPAYKLDVNGDTRVASGSDYYVGTVGLNDTTAGGSAGCSLVGIPIVSGATYTTQCQINSLFGSAGRNTGGTVTDAGSNTINVAAGTGFIKATDSDTAELISFNWAASNGLSVPSDTVRYVGVEYNSGSPQVVVKTTYDWDLDTEFPLARCVNEGGTINILNNPWWVTDGLTNVLERFQSLGFIKRDEFVGGLILSVTGTRNIAVSAGTLWSRMNEFPFTALDTSVTGTVEYYWYNGVAGTWSFSDVSQYSVTQWNDTTQATLQNLSNNWYANVWVYIEADTGEVALVYPQAQYANSASAEAKAPPTLLPPHISNHGILIGRIIIQQGNDTPISVQSAFTQTFTASLAADHGSLAGLSDDDHTQYAKLTGRSGGQTLQGGTGSGDDLTLEGSSNATNGDVFIQPTDGNVGIGTTTISQKLTVNGNLYTAGINWPDGSWIYSTGDNLTLYDDTVGTSKTLTQLTSASAGDVTDVGNCTDGACLDGSADGGTYIRLYDGDSNYMQVGTNDLSADVTRNFNEHETRATIVVTAGDAEITATPGELSGVLYIQNDLTITGWQIMGQPTGSIVVDIWRANGSIPTTSIAGSEKPSLVSASINSDTSFSTFNGTWVAGDYIGWEVESASGINWATIQFID